MNRKTKIVIAIIAVIAVAAIAFFGIYQHRLSPEKDNTIHIGVLSFLTGTYGEMGTDFLRGIQLCADEANVDKDLKIGKIILDVEDGKAIAKESINCFNRLLLKKPDAIIVAGDYQVAAIAPLADRAKTPIVVSIVGNQSFMNFNKGGWIFRNWLPITVISRNVANYARNQLKANKSAILSSQTEYGDDASKAYKDEFEKLGGTICLKQTYPADAHNVRAQILSILNTDPDQIFLSGYGPGYIAALHQLRECGWKGLILTDTTATNPETLTNVKDMSGVIFADTTFGDQPPSEAVRTFKSSYLKKYKKEANIYAAFGYDTMRIIVKCISTGKSNEHIRSELKKIRFTSLSGEVKFNDTGDCDIKIAIKKMNKNGSHIAIKDGI